MRPDANALLSSVFLALILGLGTYDYANGQNVLSVSTDKSTYNIGDIVIVFGTVPTVTANLPVIIQLLDPNNSVYTIGELMPTEDGRYSLEFQLTDELATPGSWTVKATHDDQEVLNYFMVVETEIGGIKTGYAFTVRTDKPSYVGDESITVSGTVPVIAEGLVVGILVFDPTDTMYTTEEVVPDFDGTYGFNFIINPRLAIDGIYTVQAVYDDQTVDTTFEFVVRKSPMITIDSVTPDQPRWGLDSITVYGNVVDEVKGDTVTVDWGDGTSTAGIRVSENSWGPVNHIYDSTYVGNNQIVTELIASNSFAGDEILATSEPYSVNVLKHRTYLTLDPIDNALVDDSFTVSGRLYDSDADMGISGRTIILAVSMLTQEVFTTVTVSTGSNGYYLGSGDLPIDLLGNELLFQAHFAGDDLYLASDSQAETYTIEEDFSALLSVSAALPVIAVATIITLWNVPKPRRKPKIPKDTSASISVQFEVDIKR